MILLQNAYAAITDFLSTQQGFLVASVMVSVTCVGVSSSMAQNGHPAMPL